MLRLALFTTSPLAGILFAESFELQVRDEAWLLAVFVAAVLLFCIPQPGKTRDLKDLICNLAIALGIYGILLKFRPWLGDTVGPAFATLMSGLLVIIFAGIVLLLSMTRSSNGRTSNAKRLQEARERLNGGRIL